MVDAGQAGEEAFPWGRIAITSGILHAAALVAAIAWQVAAGGALGDRFATTEIVALGLLLVGSSTLFPRLTGQDSAPWNPTGYGRPEADRTPAGHLTPIGALLVYGVQCAVIATLALEVL